MLKGARLAKAWRKVQGFSQEQAAKLVGFRDQSKWSRLESGAFIPRVDDAIKIDRATGGAVPCASWVEDARKAG